MHPVARSGFGALLVLSSLHGLLNFHEYFEQTALLAAASSRFVELVHNHHVISWKGVPAVQAMIDRYWEGNYFCEEIQALRQKHNNTHVPITVDIAFSCQELYDSSWIGTGNFISVLYHMRMSALALGNVDMHMTCTDADQVKSQLILPWFMGHYNGGGRSNNNNNEKGQGRATWSVNMTCGPYYTSPISHMYQRIQYVSRRMAIALVGLPANDPSHPAHPWAQEYLWSTHNKTTTQIPDSDLQLPAPRKDETPLFPPDSVQLDDATIHFRCGDLMDSTHPSFGFMKFSGYTKYISPDARSIGILTQPFGINEQTRRPDRSVKMRERCHIVVTSLVDYIRERYPNSRVTVHNGPDETIALAYARMTMSNQTMVGISTFGVFPAIGTFGTGYIRKPDFPDAPNQFLVQPRLDRMADNVVLFDEPTIIMCAEIQTLWQTGGADGVVNWFWNDDVQI